MYKSKLLFLAVVFSCFFVTHQAKAAITVSIPNKTVEPGTSVEIPIKISNTNGIVGFQFILNFNKEVLKLKKITPGDLINNWKIVFNEKEEGEIIVGYSPELTPISSNSGTLITVTFDVIGNSGDSTQLTLKHCVFSDENGDEIPFNISSADITIASGANATEPSTNPNQNEPFSDLGGKYSWATKYIQAIYNAGITTGYSDGTYRPGENVTRAQMAAFIARALNLQTPPCSTKPFVDVDTNTWYCPYVQAIYKAGITAGYSDGTYRPNQPVTRAQMAAFIARALNLQTPLCADKPFTDVDTETWYCSYVQAIYNAGITTGYSDGTYRPGEDVTRAQMAAFIARAFCDTGSNNSGISNNSSNSNNGSNSTSTQPNPTNTTQNGVIYQENFSSNPDFTSLSSTGKAKWDSADGYYIVDTKDDLNDKYWAYSPEFGPVDTSRPLLIQFDVMFKNQNWGTYPGVKFYAKTPFDINADNNKAVLSIADIYTDTHYEQLGIYDGYGHRYFTPSISDNTWYTVKIITNGRGKADINVIERDTGKTIYSKQNVDLNIAAFSYMGVGYYDQPNYGSEWSPIAVDNILIKYLDGSNSSNSSNGNNGNNSSNTSTQETSNTNGSSGSSTSSSNGFSQDDILNYANNNGLEVSDLRKVANDNFAGNDKITFGNIYLMRISGADYFDNDVGFAFGLSINVPVSELSSDCTAFAALFLDTDGNPNTGYKINGIGADYLLADVTGNSDQRIGTGLLKWDPNSQSWTPVYSSGGSDFDMPDDEHNGNIWHAYAGTYGTSNIPLNNSGEKGVVAFIGLQSYSSGNYTVNCISGSSSAFYTTSF